ncbi:glycoside hydrolase family 35 protein [Cucurbitaria berberidis CBS 394.84]|uniref:Beta-galactosidase n=1 Tax=Cucurbitaria berberidis CBS 394.84 TaxID=1168544 RepID=A0A9P4L3H3_9PLEO|nr:glycoside hydrolase family 35 protein [Cucurbitaria berberidis CBS 394.84]KAF1840936.1 glycoside hydrolase family 35 protein [Cucurbitaria berberidis CBS 394.84]
MKSLLKFSSAVALSCLAIESAARAVGYSPHELIKPYKRAPLQDIVTWDEHSLFVHGERIFLYSGEVHPYRLPVPDLYLDLFQKIKALGFNGVSFYVDWALLEGKPGVYRAEGVFDLQPFFDAATKAGIYLIARPGPYINAEVSGGGFPGWIQRINGTLRTRATDFLEATDNYIKHVGATIAAAQITNGGPIILVQPENEYTQATSAIKPFPDPVYMQYVEDQLRNASIVVPFISNDASAKGNNAPGQPAAVDIYGHDGYPVGFDCANPSVWPDGKLPTNWRQLHEQQSPNTPYSIVEFQAGSFDPWGGPGWDKCSVLVNAEFERVFYKQLYSFGVTILNLYMTWGGTNWGNLGHPGGYTSYDYSAPIREGREVDREKYSELKLQANFFKVSPAYLTAARGNASNSTWTTTTDLTVTPASGEKTKFYFVRHSKYNSLASTSYKLKLPTTAFGNITVPQINGTSLTLNGRDSKVHVSDYDIGGATLVYSTADIFTWHKYVDKTVLVVYGGPGETHELALAVTGLEVLEGEVKSISTRGYTLLNFKADGTRKVAKVGVESNFVYVYMLDRNEAYNYWAVDQAAHDSSNPVILKAGYLTRTAKVTGDTLDLTGDLNATTPIEILGGAPASLSKLTFNGNEVDFKVSKADVVTANIDYPKPKFTVPQLSELEWKYIDSLPEIQSSYDDSKWTKAELKKTFNSLRALTTPVSLYSSDYGYHTGTLLYRGTFTATGNETTFYLSTQGGSAFGSSAWVGDQFLGSWRGYDAATHGNNTFTLPNLTKGKTYTITVVIDNQGLDENWTIGTETMKNPRGVLDYKLSGHAQSDVTWKLTGNLGGEDYLDITRGPLNEGGLFVERQGLHLPGALSSNADWKPSKGPVTDGLAAPGIGFFATEFKLSLPSDYDIPLSFTFSNSTTANNSTGSSVPAYRVQLYVNGWQYGKFVSNVGPQTKYPVPEGILNYRGTNYLGVSLWGLDGGKTKIEGLELSVDGLVWSAIGEVRTVEGQKYEGRQGAY